MTSSLFEQERKEFQYFLGDDLFQFISDEGTPTQDNISHAGESALISSTPTLLQLIDTLFHEAKQEWSNVNNRNNNIAGSTKPLAAAHTQLSELKPRSNAVRQLLSQLLGKQRAQSQQLTEYLFRVSKLLLVMLAY